ncbi:M23 family metallopeptidase [Chitinispirillales bacterium ANBcel5]|uniref:peptidoglycan DD-metalloendopeptidase family protein n=1 Tax=Cellulosispirillum alkaliphilum TaxID=3039283 RepID=UPI002A51EA6D|nr:M23 family metallopeptidase [Chitinispirillales bacterium ANBcel5]
MFSVILLSAPFLFFGNYTSVVDEILEKHEISISFPTDIEEKILTEFRKCFVIDTFAWNTVRINAGRFDYRSMSDTVKLPLIDSARGKQFAHPFAGVVTSPFGPRRRSWHFGTDINLNTGDSVHNVLDGKVRVIQNDRSGYGKVIVVRHHSGLETVYAHLSRILVRPNERVSAGDVIGLGGSTGRVTGPHLHFETRYYGEPFDPAKMIDFDNFELKNDSLVLTREDFEYLTELRSTVWHTVRRGETLSAIARRYRTSVSALCRLNGISSSSIIRVGQRLKVRSDGKPVPEDFIIRNVSVSADKKPEI